MPVLSSLDNFLLDVFLVRGAVPLLNLPHLRMDVTLLHILHCKTPFPAVAKLHCDYNVTTTVTM